VTRPSERLGFHHCCAKGLRAITARVKLNYLPNNWMDAHKRMPDSTIVRIQYSGSDHSANGITHAFPERPFSVKRHSF
jgi:hypothetical protein